MPLTRDDLRHGPHLHIVVTRPGGDRYILDSLPCKQRELAERLLATYREQLEGCEQIELESDDSP